MLGYSSSESIFSNKTTLKNVLFNLLIEKYVDYFLFNRMNLAYHYGAADDSKLFLNVQKFHHSTNFEVVCASLPTVIILLILIPSTLLLYSLDEELEPLITYKVIGHQWF
jgi:heme/copper-type cytochrome/quinol oxidase subunit 2